MRKNSKVAKKNSKVAKNSKKGDALEAIRTYLRLLSVGFPDKNNLLGLADSSSLSEIISTEEGRVREIAKGEIAKRVDAIAVDYFDGLMSNFELSLEDVQHVLGGFIEMEPSVQLKAKTFLLRALRDENNWLPPYLKKPIVEFFKRYLEDEDVQEVFFWLFWDNANHRDKVEVCPTKEIVGILKQLGCVRGSVVYKKLMNIISDDYRGRMDSWYNHFEKHREIARGIIRHYMTNWPAMELVRIVSENDAKSGGEWQLAAEELKRRFEEGNNGMLLENELMVSESEEMLRLGIAAIE